MSDFVRNPYFDQTSSQNTTTEIKVVNQETEVVNPVVKDITPGLTSIIIPAFFNSYPVFHATGNCIGSIREHTDKLKTPYEIILVINGNTGIGWFDQDKKMWNNDKVGEAHVEKIIANQENLGYAKAVNQGIRCSSGEYLAFVNNDTQVFDHWLEDMQESLLHLDLVRSHPMYGMPWGRAVEARELRDKWKDKPIQESFTDFSDFSCVLTRKQLLERVGAFDERFFYSCEDLDLQRRIEKAGGKIACCERVWIHHIIQLTGSSMDTIPETMNESKELLKNIWGY